MYLNVRVRVWLWVSVGCMTASDIIYHVGSSSHDHRMLARNGWTYITMYHNVNNIQLHLLPVVFLLNPSARHLDVLVIV